MRKAAPGYETRELREFGEVLRGRRTSDLVPDVRFFDITGVNLALIRPGGGQAALARSTVVTET